MKNNKGITLIALIITIIVMLILAAVSITMAVNGGLFNYAKQSTEEIEYAKKEELDWSSGMAGNYSIDELIEGPTVIATTDSNNGVTLSIQGIKTKKPPIPEGFSYKEGTIDTGYVITDTSGDINTNGNEFVWVPVAKNQKICIKVEDDIDIRRILLKDPYGNTILHVSDKNVEKLYINNEITPTINGEYKLTVSKKSGAVTKTLTVRSLYEKTTLELKCNNGYSTKLADLKNYVDTKTYKESIEKNGGFYVGRFEGGEVNENVTYNRNNTVQEIIAQTGLPVCQQNKKPIGNLVSSQAKGLAESMYVNKSFKCDLLTGAAYDRIFEWFIESGSKTENDLVDNTASAVWGNYYNGSLKSSDGVTNLTTESSFQVLNTGVTRQTMVNNIYDIGGNMLEWTLENCNGGSVFRGATFFFFFFTGSPLPRFADDEDPENMDSITGTSMHGFRPAIYL